MQPRARNGFCNEIQEVFAGIPSSCGYAVHSIGVLKLACRNIRTNRHHLSSSKITSPLGESRPGSVAGDLRERQEQEAVAEFVSLGSAMQKVCKPTA